MGQAVSDLFLKAIPTPNHAPSTIGDANIRGANTVANVHRLFVDGLREAAQLASQAVDLIEQREHERQRVVVDPACARVRSTTARATSTS
jgi:hypothetical protein